MQFFTVQDESNVKLKVLLLPLTDTEMNEVSGQCAKCMPSISISSLIQLGHPYVIVDFGGDAWKTAIALDEVSDDGHKVGDELALGDVLTVILTSKSKAANMSKDKVYLKVPSVQFPLHSRHGSKLRYLQNVSKNKMKIVT